MTDILQQIRNQQMPEPLAQWQTSVIARELNPDTQAVLNNNLTRQAQAFRNLIISNDKGASLAVLFNEAIDNPAWHFGKDIMPSYRTLLLILRQLKKISLDPALKSALSLYESIFFSEFNDSIRQDIFKNRLLELVARVNIVAEMQTIYQIEQYIDEDSQWNKDYLAALMANEQLIGNVKLTLDNNEVLPAVKNWLADFNTSINRETSPQATVYDQVKYINQSPYVRSLSPDLKSLLTEILRLYLWLLQPSVDPELIRSYEQQKNDELDKRIGFVKPAPIKEIKVFAKQQTPKIDAAMPVKKKVNLFAEQEIDTPSKPRPGIVSDGGTNVQMEEIAQRLEAERMQKQASIDKKLDALKTKIKK